MCGRVASYGSHRLSTIEKALACQLPTKLFTDRYNIVPSQQVIIVRPTEMNGYEVASVKWGLIPP
jgi:putative SOS response-associated peptidase YedK